MNTKKYIIGAGAIATILVGASSLVFAENDMVPKPNSMINESALRPKPQIIQIGPEGRTLLRGTIVAVGTNSLTVKSWGGNWTVNIAADTELMPGSDMSQFKVGDFVGLHGVIATNADWTINATLVRDWTAKKALQETREMMKKERRNNQEEIKDVIKNESPRNWEGLASNVNVDAKSFTLTMGGTAYTVNVVVDAKIVNRKYLTINFADIQNEHKVRVWGPISDTTISAYVVRDISIPAED